MYIIQVNAELQNYSSIYNTYTECTDIPEQRNSHIYLQSKKKHAAQFHSSQHFESPVYGNAPKLSADKCMD